MRIVTISAASPWLGGQAKWLEKVLAEEHDKKNPNRIDLALRHWASQAAALGEKREEGDAVRDGALWVRLNPEPPLGLLLLATCIGVTI